MYIYNFTLKTYLGTREEQQDYAYVGDEKGIVFAVLCDGMGGHLGGSIASKTAVKSFVKRFRETELNNIPNFYLHTVEEVNNTIYNLRDNNNKRLNAGSTIVSVIIKENKLYWLSIGDSRLYIIRDGKIMQITKDHNYMVILNNLLKENKIDVSDYSNRLAKGNSLISHLGMPELDIIDINIEPLDLKNNDILILMSDGLYKLLSDSQILEYSYMPINDYASKLYDLVIQVNTESKDNTTFIIIKAGD